MGLQGTIHVVLCNGYCEHAVLFCLALPYPYLLWASSQSAAHTIPLPEGLLCCISFIVSSGWTTDKPKLSNSRPTCIKQHSNCAWSAVTEVCGFEALRPVVGIGLHVPKLKMVFAWVLSLPYIGIVRSEMYWIHLNCIYLLLMVESVLVWSCIPKFFSIFYFILNHLMGRQSKCDVDQMIQ